MLTNKLKYYKTIYKFMSQALEKIKIKRIVVKVNINVRGEQHD